MTRSDIPDEDLDDLVGALDRTMAEVRRHGVILDRLGSELGDETGARSTGPAPESADRPEADPPLFILAMGGARYAAEPAELSFWGTHRFGRGQSAGGGSGGESEHLAR
ncbi:SNARE domain-containing protein [Kitasatospora sp. NPDC092039]|uniref:SNARE domain-containing protein n=1 Tax=Kitasatospora sp. NPDC092039 TaxID=3364086 RepID=UPI00382BF451